MLQHIAPVIGWSIIAALFFFIGIPLILGLLIACKLLRFRDWLAMVAVVFSMAILAETGGDYVYNLVWISSRMPLALNVLSCLLIFATPPFLFVLILLHTRRRLLWSVGLPLVAGLALFAVYNQYAVRKAGDAEAYRQGTKILSPRTGTPLVRWWRDDRRRVPRYLLQGHVAEGSPLVLLTDPFVSEFQPHFCTAVASVYSPPVKDPAELGNVTEMVSLKDCQRGWIQGLAVLERPVAVYQALSFRSWAGGRDPDVLAHPAVRQKFAEFRYDPANFDISKAEISDSSGPGQPDLFITALKPIRSAPNAFPCTGPVLLLSVGDLEKVQVVLPYCTLSWNLFAVNNDLYFAAVTQWPTPPGDELAMNPDLTYWLLQVRGTELKQLWPAS